jgi:hypothetical protein
MSKITNRAEFILDRVSEINQTYSLAITVRIRDGQYLLEEGGRTLVYKDDLCAMEAVGTAPRFGSKTSLWAHLEDHE